MKPNLFRLLLTVAVMNPSLAQTIKKTTDTIKLSTNTAQNVQQNMAQSLMDNVLLRDVKLTEANVRTLKSALATDKNNTRNNTIDTLFADLVKNWKKVQTAYVLGELNSDMIDTPRLIDVYHEGNEDLDKQLTHALKTAEPAKIALFKNSFKSINALDFLLYKDNNLSATKR
ncbi:MAG: hypothetical protein ACWIPH_05625, partial [Ostreibacterium sp.]